MEAVAPGESRPIILTNLPSGLVGTLGVRLEDADGGVLQARTTAGMTEFAAGNYRFWITFPETKGFYVVIADDEGVEAIEEFKVTASAGASVAAGPLYATVEGLRSKLGLTAEVLDDDEATEVLTTACVLVDERLGNRQVDPETGRKVDPEAIEQWQAEKLAAATLELAKLLFEDPGLASRQRARFISGDVSVNGLYGPAYGELFAALLNQSGLVVNTARMSGGRRHRGLTRNLR
jgi:hypothetical protein